MFELSTSAEITLEFGKRLRAHRLAQNLQQSEIAARAGISERALRNFEHSGTGSVDLLVRVAMALGVAGCMSDLFESTSKSIKEMEQASLKRQRASKQNS